MPEWEYINEVFDPVAVVSEMATGGTTLVSLDPEVVERVTHGDPDPKFATFVIESGWSKSNRLWDMSIFDKAHEQISEATKNGDPLVGYLGHIKPEDDAYVFPEIQFQWLRSALKRVGDRAQLAVKAYVLPDTKARYYIDKGLAKAVSWYGPVEQVPFQKGVRVQDFKLESIDLARPRKAGMSAKLVAVTSEMSTEEGAAMKPEEIAALQENELRAHNPTLVQSIEQAAKQPLETKVGEMEATVEELQPNVALLAKLREALGIAEDADVLDVVNAMVKTAKEAGNSVKEKLLDEFLAKRFKDSDPAQRGLVRRLIVGEMDSIEISGDTAHKDEDEKKVGEMVNSAIDGDPDLKALASEMLDAPPSLPVTSRDRGGDRELKPGYKNSNISVRSASRR